MQSYPIRATSRLTGVHKTTILSLLVKVGNRCVEQLDAHIRGLSCSAVECDEIWTFIAKKERRLSETDRALHPEYGDQYAFVAFDPDTKLVPTFVVGKREGRTALQFMYDLRSRVTGRLQISTDDFAPYIEVVERAFGMDVDLCSAHQDL